MSAPHILAVEPLSGVGPIRLGMSKEEVSHAFPYVYQSFFKTEDSPVRSDHCVPVGLIVHYDAESKVNYIEISKPTESIAKFLLYEKDLFQLTVSEVVALLASRSSQFQEDCYGYDFPTLGIATYNNDLESKQDLIESIGLGHAKARSDA